ncbi:acyltransferase [Rhodoferax sp.]|uniref:acyltransferase family protein n=1 Tax=Rhodoferax sp. TaxID=50421 RepID=UPI002614C962|nr:acyltransferase [Rhodoferax sp.]MDD2926464.1 acyltransferase [Rhodoferax sp.]
MLRAVAAFMVLFYHSLPQYEFLNGEFNLFKLIAGFGYSGVDIFFVISGFVAAHTTLSKPRNFNSILSFIHHRFVRIYFGYWPFFVIAALSAIYLTHSSKNIDWFGSFLLTSTDMKRLLIYVTWSLTYELIFYGLTAVSLLFPPKHVIRLTFLGLLILITSLMIKLNTPLSATFLFLAFFCEFLTGIMIFVHLEKLLNKYFIFPCLAIILGSLYFGHHFHAADGSIRIFTFGLSAATLVILALTLEQTRLWVANRWWVNMGNASYTLYLAHVSLFLFFYFSGLRGLLADQPLLLREAGFFLYLLFCIHAAHTFYRHVERPLYEWGCGLKLTG